MNGCEFLTANAAADALASGELTSEELVEALLKRIERLDSRLDAFVAVYADEAQAAAREADLARRAGGRRRGGSTACRSRSRTSSTWKDGSPRARIDAALAEMRAEGRAYREAFAKQMARLVEQQGTLSGFVDGLDRAIASSGDRE